MKKLNRILGLGLSAALLVGSLAGCTNQGGDPTASPSPTATPGTSATPGVFATGTPMVETEDVIQKLVGIPRDTTIFTVDGAAVTAEQLYYWLGYTIDNVGYYSFGGAENIDWTQEQEGKSISQYILESAKQTAQLYSLMETKALAEGVVLSDTDKAELESQVAQTVEELGGQEEYIKWLQQIAMSDEAFRNMYSVSYLYNGMREKMYGEGGTNAPTDEVLTAYVEGQGKMLAKHILIKTVDAQNAELPEAELAAAKTKAEGILAQLQAAAPADLETLFDKLMNENSEDGRNPDGTLGAPDGYLFGAGEMVPEFEEGTKALEYGGLSGLVKTTYGYHIILRLNPVNEEVRAAWTDEQMNTLVDGWMAASVVEDTAEMEKVDAKAFYETLAAYRASLEPVPEETPAPTDSAAPTPTETPAG